MLTFQRVVDQTSSDRSALAEGRRILRFQLAREERIQYFGLCQGLGVGSPFKPDPLAYLFSVRSLGGEGPMPADYGPVTGHEDRNLLEKGRQCKSR